MHVYLISNLLSDLAESLGWIASIMTIVLKKKKIENYPARLLPFFA